MNRKKSLKRVSRVFLGLLAILIFIALNLYSAHYNTTTVFAQGITVASPTANQQTTQQSGPQTPSPPDLTNLVAIIKAIGTLLSANIAIIIAVIAAIKINAILKEFNAILKTIN